MASLASPASLGPLRQTLRLHWPFVVRSMVSRSGGLLDSCAGAADADKMMTQKEASAKLPQETELACCVLPWLLADIVLLLACGLVGADGHQCERAAHARPAGLVAGGARGRGRLGGYRCGVAMSDTCASAHTLFFCWHALHLTSSGSPLIG